MTYNNDEEMKLGYTYYLIRMIKTKLEWKLTKIVIFLPPWACIFLLSDMFSSFWGTILLLLGRGNWVPGVGPGLLLKYSIFRAFNENNMLSQRHPHQYHKIYQSIKSFTLAKVHYFLYKIIVEKFNNVQIYFK